MTKIECGNSLSITTLGLEVTIQEQLRISKNCNDEIYRILEKYKNILVQHKGHEQNLDDPLVSRSWCSPLNEITKPMDRV